MRIERRDPTLKYPRAIREEKRRLVLDWLLEFQFSSVELLAQRLGLTYHSSYKFFRALLDDQIIQHVKSVHTHQTRYLMLTKAGVDLLQVTGRDVSKAQTQPSRLNRYSHIMHDLAVQHAVLKRLAHYDEVIWDKHINIPEQFDNPDVLLHAPKGYWVAFEYERWRKETKRIYLSFMNHVRALIKRHYSGVYYLFDREPTWCTTRGSSRPRHGPNTRTIARPANSRRPHPFPAGCHRALTRLFSFPARAPQPYKGFPLKREGG